MSRRWRLASTASITRYSRRWLPIYGDDVIGRYHNAPYGSLPPHCFQEAEDAFSSLQKTRRNQAVVTECPGKCRCIGLIVDIINGDQGCLRAILAPCKAGTSY